MPDKKSTLARLRAFTLKLADDCAKPPESGEQQQKFRMEGISFSHEDLGGISLSREESREYRAIVSDFHALTEERASEHSIGHAVQRAILKAIDTKKISPQLPPKTRTDNEILHVCKALLSEPVQWTAVVPIVGMNSVQLPWKIGNATIISGESAELLQILQRADAIYDSTTNTVETKNVAKADYRQRLVQAHYGHPFLILDVSAVDTDGAWLLAKKQARFLLDCLNFAIEVICGSGRLYAVTDSFAPARIHRTGLVLGDAGSYFPWELDSTIPIAADQIQKRMAETPWLSKLIEYLAAKERTAHQGRILSAVHWAGRAAVEGRADQAFLHRAIALESLLLRTNDGEITKSLAFSVTHLLGDWLADKKQTFTNVKRLYKVRSKIVHSGTYDVDKVDASRLSNYLHACFERLLTDDQFTRMQGETELDDWLQTSMLGAGNT